MPLDRPTTDLPRLQGRYQRLHTYDAAQHLREDEHVKQLLSVKLHPPNCRLHPSKVGWGGLGAGCLGRG